MQHAPSNPGVLAEEHPARYNLSIRSYSHAFYHLHESAIATNLSASSPRPLSPNPPATDVLSCRKDGTNEELRGVYRFVKRSVLLPCSFPANILISGIFSMVVFHPFSTARESVLAMWSLAAQVRRPVPDACLPELFVLLHGVLFTNIQFNDFKRVLERFQEKLEIGGKFGRSLSLLTLTKQTLPL